VLCCVIAVSGVILNAEILSIIMFSMLVINATMLCHNSEHLEAGIADVDVAAIACKALLASLTSSTALAGAAAEAALAVLAVAFA
jgi:hypothetical protein